MQMVMRLWRISMLETRERVGNMPVSRSFEQASNNHYVWSVYLYTKSQPEKNQWQFSQRTKLLEIPLAIHFIATKNCVTIWKKVSSMASFYHPAEWE